MPFGVFILTDYSLFLWTNASLILPFLSSITTSSSPPSFDENILFRSSLLVSRDYHCHARSRWKSPKLFPRFGSHSLFFFLFPSFLIPSSVSHSFSLYSFFFFSFLLSFFFFPLSLSPRWCCVFLVFGLGVSQSPLLMPPEGSYMF